MRVDIYGDNIGYVTNEVSTVKPYEANTCEENRIKFVTDLAAISRGKTESKNPKLRYSKLLEEAAPTKNLNDEYSSVGSPSRPFEFLPVVLKYTIDELGVIYILAKCVGRYRFELDKFNNALGKHSYMHDGKLFTNMRAVLNAGIIYEDIPYNTREELEEFKAVKIKVPMFVFAHIVTHTAISKESQSDRYTSVGDYWLPRDLRDKAYAYVNDSDNHKYSEAYDVCVIILSKNNKTSIILYLLSLSQNSTQYLFKELGYHREIYSRAMYYFKYKELVLTGWNNDPKVWEHLFLERNVDSRWKNHTQAETKEAVGAMKEVIKV